MDSNLTQRLSEIIIMFKKGYMMESLQILTSSATHFLAQWAPITVVLIVLKTCQEYSHLGASALPVPGYFPR